MAQCDSQLSAERPDGTTRVEARFVHDVYEAIAPHFSATRYKVRSRPLRVSLTRAALAARAPVPFVAGPRRHRCRRRLW